MLNHPSSLYQFIAKSREEDGQSINPHNLIGVSWLVFTHRLWVDNRNSPNYKMLWELEEAVLYLVNRVWVKPALFKNSVNYLPATEEFLSLIVDPLRSTSLFNLSLNCSVTKFPLQNGKT